MKGNKCTKGSRCELLQAAVDSKAVEVALIFNMKTSAERVEEGVRVKTETLPGELKKDRKAKTTLLLFTYCPFCGFQNPERS